MIGHNSEAEIIRCINDDIEEFLKSEEKFEKLQEQLDTSKDEEQEPILLSLGSNLLAGKRFTEDPNCGVEGDNPDARFNAWVYSKFEKLEDTFGHPAELASLIWSAEHRDDYWDIKERYPRTRTIRGRHTKWKEEQKANNKPDDDNDNVVDTGSKKGKGKKDPKGDGKKGGNNNANNDKKGGNKKNGPNINTNNPDTTKAVSDIGLIASSFIGVKTNMDLYLQTNDVTSVDESSLANAILSEIITNSPSHMTDEEISEYIEDLRNVLTVLTESLPVLEGPESNVVNFSKLKETYK